MLDHAYLAAVQARLAPLRAAPDGTLHGVRTPLHHIRIAKHNGQVHFYFVDPSSGALNGPMSRIELARPLHLLADYTQAATLTLLWQPQPARICLLGLAGGRLSVVLRTHLPDTTVVNVEIDGAVGDLAEQYFGVVFDQRQQLAVADARQFIEEYADAPFEIIVMDAFRDEQDNLDYLATGEFYAACKRRLARFGVMCANILRSDELFFEKLKTFHTCFRTTLLYEARHGVVVFGSDAPAKLAALQDRADQLARAHQFDFPFAERARQLQPYRATSLAAARTLLGVRTLHDEEQG